jgi:hypothetical protein
VQQAAQHGQACVHAQLSMHMHVYNDERQTEIREDRR